MNNCFICGSSTWIERHHVFGSSRKKASEKYGMMCDLCHYCHNEPPNGIHHNKENRIKLQQHFQKIFEEEKTRKEFIAIFGKNYL